VTSAGVSMRNLKLDEETIGVFGDWRGDSRAPNDVIGPLSKEACSSNGLCPKWGALGVLGREVGRETGALRIPMSRLSGRSGGGVGGGSIME